MTVRRSAEGLEGTPWRLPPSSFPHSGLSAGQIPSPGHSGVSAASDGQRVPLRLHPPDVDGVGDEESDDLVERAVVSQSRGRLGPMKGDSPFAPTSHSPVASTRPPPL